MKRMPAQRGYSLAEVLVAMAIFMVVIGSALMLYDRSNKIFKQSVEASDMQQSTRVAFDKMVGDLRLTGFDFDRDGMPMSALAVTWAPGTTYTIGNLVQPDPPNGHTYVCTAGGVSNTSPPTWLETAKAPVVEGGTSTVRWQEAGNVQYQQPDEQIEFAGRRAVAIRANFDYETDAATENGRENVNPQYESAQFPVVTVGNDEIVTYALRSANSAKNTDEVVFYADTAIPREANPATKKTEKKVTITGVDLTGNNPPYTLVRFTLDSRGNPDSGTPIADNVRDMRFTYFTDTAGKTPIAEADLPLGEGMYDGSKPYETIVARDSRENIKSFGLTLVGMSPQIDRSYTDPDDTIAPNYRKYSLSSTVVPRNQGRRGVREFNVDEPGAPVLKSLCSGGCNAVYAAWEAPGTGGDIDSYSILSAKGDCLGGEIYDHSEDAGKNLDGYAGQYIDDVGVKWRFAIQAINKFGQRTSNCMDIVVVNRTRPVPPTQLKATGGGDALLPVQQNKIDLYWPPVTENEDANKSATCNTGSTIDQKKMPTIEKRYYRIVRGTSINFQATGSETKCTATSTGPCVIVDESSKKQPFFDGTNMRYTDAAPDNPTANCQTYYYRVQTVDYCARTAGMNYGSDATLGRSTYFPALAQSAVPGRAEETATLPEKPVLQLASSSCANGYCTANLTWSPVSRDAGLTNTIFINRYKLYVERKRNNGNGTTSWISDTTVAPNGYIDIYNATTYAVTNLDDAEQYRMRLTAMDCVESAYSDYLYYPCNFGDNTITVSTAGNYGGDGSEASPWVIESPSTMTISTTAAISKLQVMVFEGFNQVGATQEFTSFVNNSTTINLPELTEGTTAQVRLIATSGLCTVFMDKYVRDELPPSCTLASFDSDPTILTYFATKRTKTNVSIFLLKNSGTDPITIKKIAVKWNPSVVRATGQTVPTLNSAEFCSTDNPNSTCTASATATLTQACATTKTAATNNITVDSAVAALAAGTTRRIEFNWNAPTTNSVQPITGICVTYTTKFGDQLTCTVHPNASSTCTVGTSTSCN